MNDKNNGLRIGLAIFAAFALLAIGMLLLPVEAAPPAAPTPVSDILDTDQAQFFRFQQQTGIAADTNTSTRLVNDFDSLDIQHVIDQGTTNTTTLTIQWSIDGSNWIDGPALASNNAADASDITRVPVFGRYARINQDLTNTNTITITLVAVGR